MKSFWFKKPNRHHSSLSHYYLPSLVYQLAWYADNDDYSHSPISLLLSNNEGQGILTEDYQNLFCTSYKVQLHYHEPQDVLPFQWNSLEETKSKASLTWWKKQQEMLTYSWGLHFSAIIVFYQWINQNTFKYLLRGFQSFKNAVLFLLRCLLIRIPT